MMERMSLLYIIGSLLTHLASCVPVPEPEPVSYNPVIPENFHASVAHKPVFTKDVPDPWAASWLTLNTLSDMAMLDYSKIVPVVTIQTSSIPGVAIAMKSAMDNTMPTKIQMWALMRCMKIVIQWFKQGSTPQCTFGYHDNPWIPDQPGKFDQPLGRLHYIKKALGAGDLPNQLLEAPSDDSGYLDFAGRNDSVGTISTDFSSFTATKDLGTPNFDAADEVKSGRPEDYAAILGNPTEAQDIDLGLLISTVNYGIIALAADARPRDENVERSRVIFLNQGNDRVRLIFEHHDEDDKSDYESFVLGLVAVMWRMKQVNQWSSREFAIWRVSDKKRVIDGSVTRMSTEEAGTGGPSGSTATA